jgi:hypothetical protein
MSDELIGAADDWVGDPKAVPRLIDALMHEARQHGPGQPGNLLRIAAAALTALIEARGYRPTTGEPTGTGEHLFAYSWQSEQYWLTVEAASPAEAAMRVEAMSRADYEGEVMATVQLVPKWLSRWFKR